MVIQRQWFIWKRIPADMESGAQEDRYRQEREGWFLLGFIPLYIRDKVYS